MRVDGGAEAGRRSSAPSASAVVAAVTYQQESKFWGGIFGALALVAACVVVAAIPIDSQGRSPQEHSGPIPAHVFQLTPRSYLVDDKNALGFCRGQGDPDAPPTAATVNVKRLDAFYVECAVEQKWNDPRPLSHDYGRAVVTVVTTPIVWIAAGVILFLCMLPFVGETREERRKRKRERDNARMLEQRASETRDQKRTAIAGAYARGEINDLEFEQALDRVLRGET